jgi:hypothetical protein
VQHAADALPGLAGLLGVAYLTLHLAVTAALGLLGDDLDLDQVRHEVEDIRARFRDLSGGGTLSIGVCDSATLRRGPNLSLLQAADDALAEAKQHGPQGFVVFRPHHQ